MYPLNPQNNQNVKQPEKYLENFARTENYRNSAVPFCQRLLDEDHKLEQEKKRVRKKPAEHQGEEVARTRGEGRYFNVLFTTTVMITLHGYITVVAGQ